MDNHYQLLPYPPLSTPLVDLLLAYDQGNQAQDEKSNNGLSYRSTSSNSFSEANVGYVMFKDAVHFLEELGFITIYEGRSARPIEFGEGTKQSFHGGFATRFKPLQPLIDTALECGLKEGEFHKAFFTLMPKSVVEVRASKADGEQRGKKMPLSSAPQKEQRIVDVTAINTFLSSFTYDGMVFGGLRRLFNEGDRKRWLSTSTILPHDTHVNPLLSSAFRCVTM